MFYEGTVEGPDYRPHPAIWVVNVRESISEKGLFKLSSDGVGSGGLWKAEDMACEGLRDEKDRNSVGFLGKWGRKGDTCVSRTQTLQSRGAQGEVTTTKGLLRT